MKIIKIIFNNILNNRIEKYNELEQWFHDKGEATDSKTFNKQDRKSRRLRKQIDFLRRFV